MKLGGIEFDWLDLLSCVSTAILLGVLVALLVVALGCGLKRGVSGCVAEAKVECPPCTCGEAKQ